MPKQRLVLILGTVLALITAFLVKVWMDQQRGIIEEAIKIQAAQKQEKFMSILVAKEEIPAGDAVEADDVETKSVPERQVLPQSVTSLDRIQGMVAIADIFQGEPVTITKLAYPRAASGLADVTPVGRRAITISVDNIAAVAGMVKPGDYVDVIVLIAVPVKLPDGTQMTDNRVIPLFQNVEVLAVGQSTVGAVRKVSRYAQEQPEEEAKPQSPLITLSLTPKEAGILAYISEQGKIRLVLRNPSDNKMEPLEITDLASLLRYLSPQPEKPELPQPSSYVDVYLGLTKKRMPLSD
jgi:pilus assembly protein CpaB